MKKLIGLMACVMLLGLSSVFAQSKQVTGTITDMSGLGLPGVSVSIKGTTDGTSTDIDGKWGLTVASKDVIVISFVGMKTQEITVGGKTVFKIVLEEDRVAVEEVMVVAYGTAKKSSFTGSASVIKQEQLEKIQTADPTKALEGVATGVQITSGSGQPGSSPKIRIRGVGSINASSEPLIVVDGFPYSGKMNSIASSDISSMTVLKDASATALYGSRAANGVIIITTKQGKTGASHFNFKWTSGLSSRAIPEYKRVNSGQYYETMWKKLYNTNGNDAGKASSGLIDEVGGYNIYKGVANGNVVDANGNLTSEANSAQRMWNDDWSDELIRKTAVRNDIVLSASGGSENTKYYISGNILNEDGLATESNFKRYSARANVSSKIKDWVSVNLGLSASTSEQNAPTSSGSSYSNSFMFSRMIAPIYPVFAYDAAGKRMYNTNGSDMYDYGKSGGRARPYASSSNPLGTIKLDPKKYIRDAFSARGGVSFDLYKGLKLDIKGSGDYYGYTGMTHQNRNFGDAGVTSGFLGRSTRTSNRTFRFMSNQLLSYDKEFGQHHINVLVGHESEYKNYIHFEGTRTGFPFPGVKELATAAKMEALTSNEDNFRMESYLAKFDYDFADKYYLSASYRRDGSSRFHPDNRWGNFYSLGASWRVTQEDFMSQFEFISDLKVKASYGVTGNDGLDSWYAYMGLYDMGWNNLAESGMIASALPAPELSWEGNSSYNFGVEFGLFDGRISGNVEYFIRESEDLLFNRPLPYSTGFSSVKDNIGSLKNSGYEIDLNFGVVRNDDFKWDLGFNISSIKNEITKLPQNSMTNGLKRWEVGKSIYDFHIQDFAGVDKTTGKSLWYYNVKEMDAAGVVKVDANGEAIRTSERKTTNDYSKADKYYVGTSLPDFTGGFTNDFNYKNFNLNIACSFGIGGKILDYSYKSLMHAGSNSGQGFSKDILNAWTKDNTNTDVPVIDGDQNANATSTRFLFDGDYFKINNISLGYTVPKSFASKMKLEDLKFSVTGSNLFLFATKEGLDPQQSLGGETDNVYSPVRTVSFNINLKF